MLTYEDEPTIRHAIYKRLKKEPGLAIADIYVGKGKDNQVQVGIWLILTDIPTEDGLIDVKGRFELPPSFDYHDLHNQIDEITEQSKIARKHVGVGRILWTPEAQKVRHDIVGTGLRGFWKGSDAIDKPN